MVSYICTCTLTSQGLSFIGLQRADKMPSNVGGELRGELRRRRGLGRILLLELLSLRVR